MEATKLVQTKDLEAQLQVDLEAQLRVDLEAHLRVDLEITLDNLQVILQDILQVDIHQVDIHRAADLILDSNNKSNNLKQSSKNTCKKN
jgi:hypothetical protein